MKTPLVSISARLHSIVAFANLFEELNGAEVIIGTASISGAGFIDSSFFRRTLHGQALFSTSAAGLAVSGFVRDDDNVASLFYLHRFQYDQESEIPSTLGDMLPSRYCAWDIQPMIMLSPIDPWSKNVSPSEDVKSEVTEMMTTSNDGAIKTTDTVVGLTKLGVAHYRYEKLLLRVNQICVLETFLNHVRDAYVISLAQSFRAYGSDHAREPLSVTATDNASSTEACEVALSGSPRVFNKAASVGFMNERHGLQAPHNLHKTKDLA